MAMTREQQIALAAIGGLLLLPGLCGAYFAGGALLNQLSRPHMGLMDIEGLGWMIAQPSMMIGFLGFFLIAKATRSPRLAKAAYVMNWVAVAMTVLLAAFIIYANGSSDRSADAGGPVLVFFCGSLLIFVLPGLLAYRRAKKDRGGA
jgi:hypothetical protein